MGIVRHLIVEEYGTFVGKHSERLQVERVKTREKVAQAPLMHLETVLIATRGAACRPTPSRPARRPASRSTS